jgi:hypothetical protein
VSLILIITLKGRRRREHKKPLLDGEKKVSRLPYLKNESNQFSST